MDAAFQGKATEWLPSLLHSGGRLLVCTSSLCAVLLPSPHVPFTLADSSSFRPPARGVSSSVQVNQHASITQVNPCWFTWTDSVLLMPDSKAQHSLPWQMKDCLFSHSLMNVD